MSETKKVLIIDDEPDVCAMISRLLEKRGFKCLSVGSMANAEKSYLEFKPDLVFLDLILNKESGWEVLRRLRPLSQAVFVIMTGSHVDNDLWLDAQKLGAQSVLGKPFETEELLAALSSAESRGKT